MGQRIEWIDGVKALGIILMIFAHCRIVYAIPYIFNLIYFFHMPLFFIIAGIFFKPISLSEQIKKGMVRYIYPYMIGCLLTLIPVILVSVLNDIDIKDLLNRLLKSSFYANGLFGVRGQSVLMGDIPGIGAVWFLWGLFWALCTFNALTKCVNNDIQLGIVSILLFMIGCISCEYILLPFSIQSGLTGVIFLFAGNQLNKRNYLLTDNAGGDLSIVAIGIMALYEIKNGTIIMASCQYDSGLLSVAISIMVIVLILKYFKKHNIKGGWIGSHTLEILVANQIVTFFNLGFYEISKNLYAHISTHDSVNWGVEVILSYMLTFAIAYILYKIQILNFQKWIRKQL